MRKSSFSSCISCHWFAEPKNSNDLSDWEIFAVRFSAFQPSDTLLYCSVLTSSDSSSPWLIRGTHDPSKPPPKKDAILQFLPHGNWCTCAWVPIQSLKLLPTIFETLTQRHFTCRCHVQDNPMCPWALSSIPATQDIFRWSQPKPVPNEPTEQLVNGTIAQLEAERLVTVNLIN